MRAGFHLPKDPGFPFVDADDEEIDEFVAIGGRHISYKEYMMRFGWSEDDLEI